MTIAAALLASTYLGALRAALRVATPQRLSDRPGAAAARARLERLLTRAEALSSSAWILKITCDLAS